MGLTLVAKQDTAQLGVEAALVMAPAKAPPLTLSAEHVWAHIIEGSLRINTCFIADERLYLVAEQAFPAAERILKAREAEVLTMILSGQSQKSAAFDLGLCPSTVATHLGRALRKLQLPESPQDAPLALVLIAQAARGAATLPDARLTASSRGGQHYIIVNFHRPRASLLSSVTPAEREVALALIEGLGKWEIAKLRRTSINTVGRQVSALFTKLNVKGRLDLIRRMTE